MEHPPPYSTTRTRSLPRETEAVRRPYPKRTCRPRRSEPCGYEYECARKQLSDFNESLPRRPLTCAKYEWANLVLDIQEKSGSGLSRGSGGETDNVDPLCYKQNPTLLPKRHHLGLHGIEENGVSCYEQEKEPVLDSNEEIRRTIQSMDCVTTTNPSSASLKDYFSTIYSDVGVNDLRSSECPDTINMEGVVENSMRGSVVDNVDPLCYKQNPTLLPKRYHLGLHGIEENGVSCYEQEKEPVLDSNEEIRRTIQSMDCVTTTNPSSASLKDYFSMIYSDVGVNDLRSSECLDTINMGGVVENSMRGSVVDSIIEVDHACRDDMREGGMLDHHGGCDGYYQDGGCSVHSGSNVSRGSQEMEIAGEHSGSRGFVVEHGLEVNMDEVREDYGFEREGGLGSYEEVLYESKEMLEAEELGIQELSSNRISYDDVYVDGQCSAEDLKQLSILKEQEQPPDELAKPASFDIKKRLGGPAQSIKERLGYSSRPLIKRFNRNIKKRLSRSNLDDFNYGVVGDDLLDVDMKWSNMEEPLEDSERFKQLVQNAFLKFVKALYENPAQQSKFTKQGGRTTLWCNVCGSNSKEFTSTHGLLQHAFMCRAAGLRAEHLGFHKAVCVLTGWNYEATPNGSWVSQTLSNAEALAVKEDLIIWPSVVFVHNSSLVNANPAERMIVSIGKLKAVIKGMGFDRGMTKICRGKAANQSIMVVNFHGTLSGLQEAEKLHKHYAENKHGRCEFQQITSRSKCTSDGSQNKDKIESFLYGYLGTIEDLDKLDFKTKRQCVVKSKKEIHAIAGAPFQH